MFSDGKGKLSPRAIMDRGLAPIEETVIRRLAKELDRDSAELDRELRAADRDLPVEARALTSIASALEEDFAVRLPAADVARLNYVSEMVLLIARQAGARARLLDRYELALARPLNGRRPPARRRPRAPQAPRSASDD
jgi:acyl carrier protein